jgi:hypothetical protein
VTYEPVDAPVPLDKMLNRIDAVVQAKKPFGLLTMGDAWNCESFARFVRAGLAVSKQANGFWTTAALVAGVILLVKLSD